MTTVASPSKPSALTSASMPAAASDTPIDLFSKCHDGILRKLDAFAELPHLLEQAARVRLIAAETVKFFRDVVYAHHVEEERELFPAVLASATPGAELEQVRTIAARLTEEHRALERAFEKLESGLKAVAKGKDATLNGDAVAELVARYEAHARYEEAEFLPLSQTILGRNDAHMAALGLSIHMRHAMPQVLGKFPGYL